MERYATILKDLAPRNELSGSMTIEISEGRCFGPLKNHIYLQIHHLPPEEIKKQLSGISKTVLLT
jgi:succinate dehydrogenase (ubiquinone) flavoprotein subunit